MLLNKREIRDLTGNWGVTFKFNSERKNGGGDSLAINFGKFGEGQRTPDVKQKSSAD